MATWKKVVVSGSSAELAALKVDNLTSGQVVIGGGQAANLSTTAINGTGNIVATTAATGLSHSGSFSGSFTGVVTGSLLGTAATASFVTGSIHTAGNLALSASYALTASFALNVATLNNLTAGEGITAFTYNGSSAASVAISGAADLTDGRHIKWDNTANKVANSLIFDDGTNVQITGSSVVISGSSTALIVTGSVRATGGFTGSLFGTASWANNAVQVANSLVAGAGLTGTTFNGSAASTFAVGAGALITVNADDVQVATSSLSNNQIPKFINNSLSGSNITDTGNQIQISANATQGLLVNAGGVTVTGNSTFNNNVRITGDLNVAGTASFENTQNLLIGDRFISLASGSTSLTDGGIIVVSSTGTGGMSGSAFYLEAASAGTFGRFAVAANVHASASTVSADEYMVSAKINQASNPVDSTPPTWGSSTNGSGNMWITNTGDIFIYVL